MTEEAKRRKAEYVKNYRRTHPERVIEWRQRELESRDSDCYRERKRTYTREYINRRGRGWANGVFRKSSLRRRIISRFGVTDGPLYEALVLVGNFRHSYRRSAVTP